MVAPIYFFFDDSVLSSQDLLADSTGPVNDLIAHISPSDGLGTWEVTEPQL